MMTVSGTRAALSGIFNTFPALNIGDDADVKTASAVLGFRRSAKSGRNQWRFAPI